MNDTVYQEAVENDVIDGNIDANNPKMQALSSDYEQIEDYLFELLSLNREQIENPELILKNYFHLMCHICQDVKEIKNRIKEYQDEFARAKDEKSNEAEFRKRKLVYFCKLNKQALDEINEFVADGIPQFLLEQDYDTLKSETENGYGQSLFYRRRYKYSLHRDYYSIDFPFECLVKVKQYLSEKYDLPEIYRQEEKLLNAYRANSDKFFRIMDRYVVQDNVIKRILGRICSCYHLIKRQEIFETLAILFAEEKYQSFNALGVLQVEGLFDDYCEIRFGESQNHGTLTEKAQKALESKEFDNMRLYPYFAFDIPLLRNEVAHKGLLKEEGAKRIAYNIVLDLNTLSQIVFEESFNKFNYTIQIYEFFNELSVDDGLEIEEVYFSLLERLAIMDAIVPQEFWQLFRNPEKYEKEIEFYRDSNLPEGMIDLPGMIETMFNIIRSETFWKAMNRFVESNTTEEVSVFQVEDFARNMKNRYIGILEGKAKGECIEVAKIVDRKSLERGKK